MFSNTSDTGVLSLLSARPYTETRADCSREEQESCGMLIYDVLLRLYGWRDKKTNSSINRPFFLFSSSLFSLTVLFDLLCPGVSQKLEETRKELRESQDDVRTLKTDKSKLQVRKTSSATAPRTAPLLHTERYLHVCLYLFACLAIYIYIAVDRHAAPVCYRMSQKQE